MDILLASSVQKPMKHFWPLHFSGQNKKPLRDLPPVPKDWPTAKEQTRQGSQSDEARWSSRHFARVLKFGHALGTPLGTRCVPRNPSFIRKNDYLGVKVRTLLQRLLQSDTRTRTHQQRSRALENADSHKVHEINVCSSVHSPKD